MKRKYAKRKHLKEPNLVEIYGEGYGPIWGDPLGHGYPELRQLYFELLRTFSPAVEHHSRAGDRRMPLLPNTGSFHPSGTFTTFHLMTPEQQKIVNETYQAMGAAVGLAYERGLNYGRNLLSQLVRAEIKIGDFEQPHRRCVNCEETLPTGNNICPNCHEDNEDK